MQNLFDKSCWPCLKSFFEQNIVMLMLIHVSGQLSVYVCTVTLKLAAGIYSLHPVYMALASRTRT